MWLWWLPYKFVLLAVAAVIGLAVTWHRRSLHQRERDLASDLSALSAAAPGGSPQHPLEVPTAALVESRGREQDCLACDDHGLDVEFHGTETFDGERLRVLRLSCPGCGAERELYVRIRAAN